MDRKKLQTGLHISMIGVSVYKFLRKCRLTFLEAGVPSAGLLLFYGMMTGFSVSTVRAVGMFLVMIFGDITGKTYDMASAMSLAALIILLQNPLQVRQAGFLLSFGAVLGICCVYPILESMFHPKRKLFRSILFSISLSLITYPLSVHFYYEYPMYSMALNLIVIPLMPLVMISGIAGMLTASIHLKMAGILGFPAHLVLSLYDFLGRNIIRMPLAVLRPGKEADWQLLVYYILLFAGLLLLWYGRRRIYGGLLPAAVLIVSLRFGGNLKITMLDVGQGDGIFLRFPSGTTCLIDGGSSSVKQLAKYRILPFLKHEGVSKLDYVIFSHMDEDHISGIRELLELMETPDHVTVGRILFPEIGDTDEIYRELWDMAETMGIETGKIKAGDSIREENILLECLYPEGGSTLEDKNNGSVVLHLTYKKFSALFTGDLGFKGEELLLQKELLKDIDVWKVSHHGSKNSGSISFLKEIMPNVSLISVGKNFYGHPSGELLERLNETGSSVWSTIDTGAITLECDGEAYRVFLQRERD